jgi:NAD(P)H-dependent FMN reductase
MDAGGKVLALSGSIRSGSWNKRLLSEATRYLDGQGVPTLTVSLADHELPIYNGDVEASAGMPANGVRLRNLIAGSRALLITTPEYNGSVTPLLKNVIDWTSRAYGSEPATKIYQGKIVCLAGASQGDKGALRGLSHLASVFMNMGAVVVPRFFGLSFVTRVMDDTGVFTDPKMRKSLETYLDSFIRILNDAK